MPPPAAAALQLPSAAAIAQANAAASGSGAATAVTAQTGPASGTSSDPEATRLYPVLVLLDAQSHWAAATAAANDAAAQAAAAAIANPHSAELAAAAAAAANPTASPSAWLLQPSAISTQVIPAFAAMLAALPNAGATPAPSASAAAAAAAAASSSAPASSASSGSEVADVVLLTREDVETALPKKKGGGAAGSSSGASAASKDAKKKKAGEELSAEEAFEAANYSLSRDIVEQLKERIDAALISAREAMLERRRIEAELLLDPTGGAGADAKGKGAKGGKKPAAGAASSASKAKPSASTLGTQPPSPQSGSNKKSSSGKTSSRPSRSPSPSASKPGTPSQTARGESAAFDGAAASSAAAGASAAVRYPLSLPVHFVLFDVVRTVGDAQRVQEILGHAIDAWVQLEDPAQQAARDAAHAAAEANDVQEFLYGSPTMRGGEDSLAAGASEEDAIEARLAREAREEAVTRAAVPLPHPHDQTVYGKRPPVAPLHAPEGSLLAAIVNAQSAPNSAFRNLVFLPVTLPVPTSAPTLGTSISTLPPMAAPGSPPTSARSSLKAGASTTATAAGAAAPGASVAPVKDAKKPAAGKKGAVEAAAPPSPEAELAARLVGDLILSLREFSQSRADFSAWGSRAKVVPMPRAPAPVDSVDCRLYNHLLASLPPATVDVSAMLYAMFEQVGVHAPAASASSAAAPSGVDLNAFFAGEKLDAVEEFMSAALSRVTFNAAGGAPAGAKGWASASGDLSSPKSLSASGVLGGRARFDGEGGLSSGSSASPFLKFDDTLAIRRAEAALSLGLPLVADATSAAAEELLASRWPLPGVGRRGMPSKLGEAAVAKAGEEATTLLARATASSSSSSSADGDVDGAQGPRLSAAVFERALLLLELEEMLLVPSPEFKHTLLAARDSAQDTEKEVKVVPAGGSASGNTGSVQTPAAASLVVRERNPGCSLYHTAHTRVESSTIEAAVGARLRELHAESKARAAAASTSSGAVVVGGFGPGFGLRDESDAGEDRQRWALEQRSYQEELDARVLPQRLREAMFPPCPSQAVRTQVRYRPLSDELLVVVAAPIPLTRRRTLGWSQFLTPNLSLQRWLAAGVPVQRQRPLPRVLYEFAPECSAAHSGKLASKVETFFAVEQGRLGVATTQVGESARAFVFLEKEGILVTMEKVPIEEEEDLAVSAANAAAAAATAATVELVDAAEDSDAAGKSTSRPSSRGDGTARDSSRKGSAGRERSSTKKPAAAAPGSGAGAAPLKKPSSASGSGSSSASKPAGPQTATSKRKAAQEQKEAEEAAAIVAAQQAEADAAARQILAVQAAAEARLRAPPKAPREAILLAARLTNDTRFVVSGHRADGSSRASYTARSGLVLEVRGAGDEVYMKYPRSVLEGGEVQPVAPARKHGLASGSSSAGDASDSSSASFFLAPPLSVPAFSSEMFRSVSPSGAVFKRSQDGSSWILMPNGHVGFRAGANKGWVWTTNDGERFGKRPDGSVVDLAPIQVAQQYDAESGATVWTRADATMFISYADGSSLAQHADGTRIYVDELVSGDASDAEPSTAITGTVSLSAARRRVVVEHPQFPPLTFSHHVRTGLRGAAESFASASSQGPLSSGVERVHAVQFEVEFAEDGGAKLTKHACSDAVTLSRRSGEQFVVLPRGRVLFVPASFDRSELPPGFLQGLGLDSPVAAEQGPEATDVPKHVYEFDLSLASSGRLRLQDTEDNLFRLSCAGVCKMTLGRERNLAAGDADPIPAAYYPLPSPPAQPRLFVVRGDGTGCELLHNEQVQAFLAEVASDPQTKVMQPEAFLDSSAVAAAAAADEEDEQIAAAAVSMKYLTPLVPRPPYTRHPVIPNVVRAAPSGLAAGSSLAALGAEDPLEVLRAAQDSRKTQAGATPPTLVFRHLLHTPTVSAAQKARAAAERAAFADWQESQRAADAAYERDAARAAGGARAAEEKEESARVEDEVARARQSMRARKTQHQHALSQHELAAVSGTTGGSGTSRGSRPSTANAHRLPSSQHLLPKPLHEPDEAQQVVEAMVQTLKQPPKTFFAAKQAQTQPKKKTAAAGAPATGSVLVRPPSASALAAQASGGPASFGTFFAQPAFRRDFLLSTLAARVNDLAAPYIPGSRQREGEEAGEASDAAEQEELWASLDAPAREQYSRQFSSQLRLLIANCESFAATASAFLSAPYDPSLRQISLQSPGVLSILRGAHDGFAGLVDTLASALGFERENECYVLTSKDDAEFRDNLRAFRSKMQEIKDSASSAPVEANAAPARQTQTREEAKESRSALSARGDDDGLPDGAGDSVDFEAVVAMLTSAERAAFMATPAYQQYLAREARLKAIPATYATQQHASHGTSFKAASPFAPHQPHYPPQPPRTALSANPVPTALDVTGAPRRTANRVALPAALAPGAEAQLNQKHLLSELQAGQPRSSPKTSSTVKQSWHDPTAPFAQFVLQPAELDLGVLRKGCTYRATVTLTNAGSVTGRFQVMQPDPAARSDLVHIKVLYRPGLVAPGLQRRLEVELYAGSVGAIDERIEVKAEAHTFSLPLHARVLSDADYARAMDGGVGAASPLGGQVGAVASTQAPALNASYARNFPASPAHKNAAGPFTLTSTFSQPTKAGPAFSKNSASLSSTLPKSNFGQTGEIRMIQPSATPYVAQQIQKQQQRGAGRTAQHMQPDDSEI